MNHNVLASRLPAAALVGALAATALAGCSEQAEHRDQKHPAVGGVLAPTPARKLNAAESAGTILFAASTRPGGPHDIYKKDLHTGQITNLTNTPNADELNPQVSPDGEEAVYAGNNNPRGNYQIYRVTLASGTIVQLTNHAASDFDPTYRPNGNILYKSNGNDGRGDIWEMTGEGQNRRNLTPDRIDTEEWKPAAVGDNLVVFTTRHADDGSMTPQQLAKTDDLMLLDTSQPDSQPKYITNNGTPDWYSEADPNRPGVIAFTSKATAAGPDVIYEMNVTEPDPYKHRAQLTDPTKLPGDSNDCSWANSTLLFTNNGSGRYKAMARTPEGAYYELVGNMGGDVLSPVAVGPITIG